MPNLYKSIIHLHFCISIIQFLSMKKIPVLFQHEMQKENASFSPSSSKPKLVLEDWLKNFGSQVEAIGFEPLNKKDFYRAHDVEHVDSIFAGQKPNGFNISDKDFASTFPYTSGSLYAACLQALEHGVAVSPTSGFHHAEYSEAMGFCTFNGLMISSIMLHEQKRIKNIGILDFDMHYGNGTDDIIKHHQIDYITHYTAGKDYDIYLPHFAFLKPLVKKVYDKYFAFSKKSLATSPSVIRQRLLKKLGKVFIKEIPDILEKFKDCDLIIYQAGADQHINDPYGGLITYEQMKARDLLVFEFAKKHNIPIVWNLAGGYQRDEDGSIEPVLKCHRNTMAACLEVYGKNLS